MTTTVSLAVSVAQFAAAVTDVVAGKVWLI